MTTATEAPQSTLTKAEQRIKTQLSKLIDLRNPVALAVEAMRNDAIQRMKQAATETVERVRRELESVGNDVNKCAPYPSSRVYGSAYHVALRKYRLFNSLTEWLQISARPEQPCPVKMSPDGIERFIVEAMTRAALDYDAFVVKLCEKIGTCESATISGSHVWGYSRLQVTKTTGTEIWQTQQIINTSKLGKLFNQWPSRKVKA